MVSTPRWFFKGPGTFPRVLDGCSNQLLLQFTHVCSTVQYICTILCQVDLELMSLPEKVIAKESNIKRYKDGLCTCGDVKADVGQMGKMDTMRPQFMALKKDRQKPKSRTHFEARCPKSFNGECPKDAKVSWHCLKCHVQVGHTFYI